MKTFHTFLPFIAVALVFAVGGFLIGVFAIRDQDASIYKATSTVINAKYEWVCKGMQGCICYKSNGDVADRTRQINEKSCLAPLVPTENSAAKAR